MPNTRFSRITESGVFEWPWTSPHGLLVIAGAAGGGGGGGAFCLEGLNLYGAGGGKGYETGAVGVAGANGYVIFVPMFAGDKGGR
jgi:hypothetical protein